MYRKVTLILSVVAIISLYHSFTHAVSTSERPNILFIHHSVGHGLIRDGSVREILTEAGVDFWDHGYNDSKCGLRNAEGKPSGCYWIPDNNTNPDGLALLFNLNPDGNNAFNKILKNHDITLFKSCFPASKITGNNRLKDRLNPKRRSIYNYKRHYLNIRKTADKYSGKIFVIVSQPPLHPNLTNKDEASRARAFVKWLTSKDYLGNRKNLFVFDYFGLLADPETNMLRKEYQIDPNSKNSHPSPIANMLIAPKFADFIVNIYKNKSNTNLPKVTFDNPLWPHNLTKLNSSTVTLKGKVISDQPIKKIFWSDLKGHGGDLPPREDWVIKDLILENGVTKILVTALSNNGLRSSSVIGLQYYQGKRKKAIIFDQTINRGSLSGIHLSAKDSSSEEKLLIINGNGQGQRAAINDIALDISDFDPQKSFLEIEYDQGMDKTTPRVFIPGIGDLYLHVDNRNGFEKISIPLNKFTYVHNILNRFIIRGTWLKGTNVYIKSIKLISNGAET